MAKATLSISVRFAWWTKLYLYGVRLMCWITGQQPDADKVVATMMKGVTLKAESFPPHVPDHYWVRKDGQ